MLLLLLTACFGADPSGVWYFELSVEPLDEDACGSFVTHNFIDAGLPEELAPGDWTDESDQELSPRSFFGLVTREGKDGTALVIEDEVYLGQRTDDGDWSFVAERYTDSSDRTAHSSGYVWEEGELSEARLELLGALDGPFFAGSWGSIDEEVLSWSESDTWSEEAAATVGTTGQIPASSYLVKDDGAGGVVSASNTQAATECLADPCILSVTTSCSYTWDAVGYRTELDPEAYEPVEDAGQDAGY